MFEFAVGVFFRKLMQAVTLAVYVNGGIISGFIGSYILLLIANWAYFDLNDKQLGDLWLSLWWLYVPVGWMVSLHWLQRDKEKGRETLIAILNDEEDWVKFL